MVHPISVKKRQETTETNDFWSILGFLGAAFGDFFCESPEQQSQKHDLMHHSFNRSNKLFLLSFAHDQKKLYNKNLLAQKVAAKAYFGMIFFAGPQIPSGI